MPRPPLRVVFIVSGAPQAACVTHQALVKGAEVKKQIEPITTPKQRGAAAAELLFAIAALGAAVLAGAMMGPKYPYGCGE